MPCIQYKKLVCHKTKINNRKSIAQKCSSKSRKLLLCPVQFTHAPANSISIFLISFGSTTIFYDPIWIDDYDELTSY